MSDYLFFSMLLKIVIYTVIIAIVVKRMQLDTIKSVAKISLIVSGIIIIVNLIGHTMDYYNAVDELPDLGHQIRHILNVMTLLVIASAFVITFKAIKITFSAIKTSKAKSTKNSDRFIGVSEEELYASFGVPNELYSQKNQKYIKYKIKQNASKQDDRWARARIHPKKWHSKKLGE